MKRFSVIIFVFVAALILFTEVIKSSKQEKTTPTTIDVMEPDSTINLQQVNLSTDMKDGTIPVVATY